MKLFTTILLCGIILSGCTTYNINTTTITSPDVVVERIVVPVPLIERPVRNPNNPYYTK